MVDLKQVREANLLPINQAALALLKKTDWNPTPLRIDTVTLHHHGQLDARGGLEKILRCRVGAHQSNTQFPFRSKRTKILRVGQPIGAVESGLEVGSVTYKDCVSRIKDGPSGTQSLLPCGTVHAQLLRGRIVCDSLPYNDLIA
jgi:hypothetical protein